MVDTAELLSKDEALIILGSLNAMEEDREHDTRSGIQPVQLAIDNSVVRAPFFNNWGELGVGSMICMSDSKGGLIYLTTGSDLVELRLEKEKLYIREFEIPDLKDVHEITLIDGLIWLANTGYDEAVAFSIKKRRVVQRIRLEQYRLKAVISNKLLSEQEEEHQEVDRFHCNQIFKGMDGKLYALVHHASGKQLITRIAKKFIKRHGDGGVIELASGRAIQLWLKGPHSVRIVNNEYWVCDSGNNAINIYNSEWRLRSRIPTNGWGRGADLSIKKGFFYTGISATRKRYRGKKDSIDTNMVEVFRINDGYRVGEIIVPDGIEQVNNVYIIPRNLADALICLSNAEQEIYVC